MRSNLAGVSGAREFDRTRIEEDLMSVLWFDEWCHECIAGEAAAKPLQNDGLITVAEAKRRARLGNRNRRAKSRAGVPLQHA